MKQAVTIDKTNKVMLIPTNCMQIKNTLGVKKVQSQSEAAV